MSSGCRLLGASLLAALLLGPPPAAAQIEGSAPFSTAGTTAEEVDRALDGLRAALAKASAATAFANWQGVTFDDGRIWLRPAEDGGLLRIVTINEPAASAAEAPGAP